MNDGDGMFLGVGLGVDGSTTDGPLPVLSTSYSDRQEINAGFLYAGGASWDQDNNGELSSVGLSRGKAGLGFGAMNASGKSTVARLSTPTFGEMWGGAKSSFSQWFGGSQSSAAGGFVIYPSKINANTMQQVYSK